MSTSRIDYCPLCCGDELDDGYCHDCGTDWTDPEDALRAADSLRMNGNLKQDSFTDYTLKDCADSVWITIHNISVYLRRTDEGVAVSLYPVGREMDDEIVGTWALFAEADPPDEEVS